MIGNEAPSSSGRPRWLTTDQAAEYIGLGKTRLYALSQTGRIPVSKVGKKWMYEATLLDEWLRTNKGIEAYFMQTGLRLRITRAYGSPNVMPMPEPTNSSAGAGEKP